MELRKVQRCFVLIQRAIIIALMALLVLTSTSKAAITGRLYRSLEDELMEALHLSEKNNDIPSTLLLLKILVDDAVRKGERAPDYNLCELRVRSGHTWCEANKGIKRIDMPQLTGKAIPGSQADNLPKNHRGEVDAKEAFVDYLMNVRHYTVTDEEVPVASLKATQDELIGSKVAGIWMAIQDTTSASAEEIREGYIVISSDNYILDGHHRWAAILADAIRRGTLDSTKILVKRVNAPILKLVKDANAFAQEFGIQAEAGVQRPVQALPA